ncbi:DNA-binding transcriptional MerR regulator [Pseudomonas nitritireducens]|uniref:DNA-binding transcriptional MerR regulator n=1 Tax=Pseudomonas nitroreducens TaxID=46680 RepID=A0A7W7KIZ0_PSENT|nr:MerR family transcriptional regulator [Pseudomonas nitritireducens]MBB4863229.1 DNA-binding transcriptional MerR regulator [Pseudomonas nitritireducens]
MKIGELARLSGLAPSRIRFYEASGLIAPARRLANGYREYPAETLDLLEIIRSAQQTGFSLEEIRSLLPHANPIENGHGELVAGLRRKVAEIETMERQLQANRERLLAVIDEIENKPEGMGCQANAERMLAEMRERKAKSAGAGQARAGRTKHAASAKRPAPTHS